MGGKKFELRGRIKVYIDFWNRLSHNIKMYKPFDSKLFSKNDPVAKVIAIKYLSKKFSNVRVNPDKFGADIIAESSNRGEFFVEVEIKQNWDKDIFPFETLNIPYRKRKFLKHKEILFMVLAKDLKKALVTEGKSLKENYLNEVENKYVSKGELFYQIPIDQCKLIIF